VRSANLNVVLRHLRRLRGAGPEDGDAGLLQRFVALRDETAFAELLGRHGPMVLGACRRVLGDSPDAEDAFQATFLVLVQKAATLRDPATLANWLYGVVVRVARKARTTAERRRARERQAIPMRQSDDLEAAIWRDLRPVLDEELERLPPKYRTPLVLCYFEGHSHEEAARKLGWTNGTICGRLARARDLLRKRLMRRGLAPSAAALATLLGNEATAATVPAALFDATLKAALGCAAGTGIAAAQIAALTKGALNAMFWSKCKAALLIVVTLGALAGAGGVVHQALSARPAVEEPTPLARENEPEKKETEVLRDLLGDPLPPGALARMGTNRLTHDSYVHTLAFGADGKTLLFAGVGDKVRFCEATTGTQKHSLECGGDFVEHLALSPDGKTVALSVGTWEKGNKFGDKPPAAIYHVSVREIATGKELYRLKVGAGKLAFSPDGKCLATMDDRSARSVRLWDAVTGEKGREIPEPRGTVGCMAFSPDSKLLATGVADGVVRFWDPSTGKEVGQGLKHDLSLGALAFTPDGKLLATGTGSWRPDGRIITTTASDEEKKLVGTIHLWNVAERKETGQLEGHLHWVSSLAFAKDGKTLASAGVDATVRLWDVSAGKQKHRFEMDEGNSDQVVFSPDGQIVAATTGHHVRLWDANTGKEISSRIGHRQQICLLAFSPDGKTVASAAWQERVVCVWEAGTGKLRHRLERHTNLVTALTFTQDGSALVSGSFDEGAARVWDPATGKERRKLGGEKGKLDQVAVSPAGDVAALRDGRPDGGLWLYATATGRKLHRLGEDGVEVGDVAFSPDGKVVATVERIFWKRGSEMVRLWDPATGKELAQFKGRVEPLFWRASGPGVPALLSMAGDKDLSIRPWEGAEGKDRQASETLVPVGPGRLVFSPDGRTLAVGSHSQASMQLWDLMAGKPIAVCKGSAEWDWRAGGGAWFLFPMFSPDGRTLATCAEDGKLQLWEAATGEVIRSWGGGQFHLGPGVAFSPDGRNIAVRDGDTILVWDVTGRIRAGDLPRIELKAKERESLWSDLNDANVPKAHAALWTLVAAGDSVVPFILEKLKEQEAGARRVDRLIADLDAEQFAAREQASAELEKLGGVAEAALRQALKKEPPLEVRRRLESLLEKVVRLGRARSARLVQVLEQIGTPEARKVLEEWAQRDPEARLTCEARTSLERLKKRP
jgi:RNA polymerase sigma factor (sigma-70 family)